MSNAPDPGPQLTKSTMSPAEWLKIIGQFLTLLVGLGGISALWGIQAKQPSPDTPLPVVPVVSPNPTKPDEKPLVPISPTYVTKDEMTKMISDSEARIIKGVEDKLKSLLEE